MAEAADGQVESLLARLRDTVRRLGDYAVPQAVVDEMGALLTHLEAGIAQAKGGRPKGSRHKVKDNQIRRLVEASQTPGFSVQKLADELGLSRQTVYTLMKDEGIEWGRQRRKTTAAPQSRTEMEKDTSQPAGSKPPRMKRRPPPADESTLSKLESQIFTEELQYLYTRIIPITYVLSEDKFLGTVIVEALSDKPKRVVGYPRSVDRLRLIAALRGAFGKDKIDHSDFEPPQQERPRQQNRNSTADDDSAKSYGLPF